MSEKIDWVKKNKEEAEVAAQMLTKAVNNMNFDMKAFVETIMCEHRTLQQNVFQAFLHLCEAWAKAHDDDRFDLRNEFTVTKAKEIMELVSGCPRTPLF